jgi:hypothetical protein
VSRLENLSPDLHAALSLLLRQRKSYAELATLLGIEERAVHDRAHAALALLAPRQARELSGAERERLGDYLLGQQDPATEVQTRAHLERSAPARDWAQALTAELAPLAPDALPEIPAPAPAAPSSRTGGAIVLGALAVVAIVAVLLIVGVGGGGSSHSGTGSNEASTSTSGGATSTPSAGASTGGAASTPAGGSSTSGTSPSGAASTPTGGSSKGTGATHGKALTLTPPDPATSKALGVAYVLSEKGQRAFYVFAKELPPTTGATFYAVWLEGASSAPPYPLGSLPAVSSSGLVEGGGPLPANAGSYTRIIVTTETNHKPTHPGPTVLGGTFTLG